MNLHMLKYIVTLPKMSLQLYISFSIFIKACDISILNNKEEQELLLHAHQCNSFIRNLISKNGLNWRNKCEFLKLIAKLSPFLMEMNEGKVGNEYLRYHI